MYNDSEEMTYTIRLNGKQLAHVITVLRETAEEYSYESTRHEDDDFASQSWGALAEETMKLVGILRDQRDEQFKEVTK